MSQKWIKIADGYINLNRIVSITKHQYFKNCGGSEHWSILINATDEIYSQAIASFATEEEADAFILDLINR